MNTPHRIDRRTALKWMATVSASVAFPSRSAFGQGSSLVAVARGYGTDPDLHKVYRPGELWPLTFTESQRRTAAALCDVIIPADAESPAASAVGVVDFLDEWISAPYSQHQKDRAMILPGLVWIDEEARRRFNRDFAALVETEKKAICDDVCLVDRATLSFKQPARFFALYRDLTAGGFYTTPEGIKDLRYVGNMPLATYDGPPFEVLRQAGLA